jgi:type II secretory pathway pseudopilin PulG
LPSSSHKTTGSSSKKIILYAIIGIIAVAAVYISMSARSTPEINNTDEQMNTEEEAIQRFEQQFCGTDTSPNSNAYITELTLPTECEMPLGIAIDGEKVWYVSTKRGLLGSYDTAATEFTQYEIPSWPSRSVPFTAVPSWSMSWTLIQKVTFTL